MENQLQNLDKLERSELFTPSNENIEATDRGPLVLTYFSLLPNIHEIEYKHLHVPYQRKRMQEVFVKAPLVDYIRGTNLCDTWVHGKTNKNCRCM